MTENALKEMNLGGPVDKDGVPEEVRQARMGDWERDLSQALTPGTAGAVSIIMPMLNIMATKDFGRGINLEEFAESWKILQPFKQGQKGPDKLTMAALDYLEMNPENTTDFSGLGNEIAAIVGEARGEIQALGGPAAQVVGAAGEAASGGLHAVAGAAGGTLRSIADLASSFGEHAGGGVGKLLGDTGKWLSGAGDDAAVDGTSVTPPTPTTGRSPSPRCSPTNTSGRRSSTSSAAPRSPRRASPATSVRRPRSARRARPVAGPRRGAQASRCAALAQDGSINRPVLRDFRTRCARPHDGESFAPP